MKKEKEKKKKLFGRNLFTLLFVIIVVGVLGFIIGTTIKNVSRATANSYKPFQTDSSGKKLETFNDAPITDGKNFTDFGIYLKCIDSTSDSAGTNGWDKDAGTALYKVALIKNGNTEGLNISGNKVTIGLCLMADWLGWTGFISYGSTSTYTVTLSEKLDSAKSATSSTYKRSYTVSNVNKLPAKLDVFPFGITLKTPNIYLYLSYTTAKNKTVTYILKYNYNYIYNDEYNAIDLSGAIAL